MNCPPEEKIIRLIDGELSPPEKKAVQDHLIDCPGCRSLYEELKLTSGVLKHYRAGITTPRPENSPSCPDEEIIIAYADGSIIDGKKRKEIAAHLARCDYCAMQAAGARETARLLKQIEGEGPRKVPPGLAARARDRFFPGGTVVLGRIIFKLEKLREGFNKLFEYGRPIPQTATGVAEAPSVFKAGEELRETKQPEDGTGEYRELRGAGLSVAVKLRQTGSGRADLGIRLTDERARPLSGIRLKLEKGRKEIKSRTTGSRGGASFQGIKPDKYRLLICHRKGAYLDLRII